MGILKSYKQWRLKNEWLKPTPEFHKMLCLSKLHYYAYQGRINEVPVELITDDNLTKIDHLFGAPIWAIVARGELDLIPIKAITAKVLVAKCGPESDETALHAAIITGTIKDIRPTVLIEALSLIDEESFCSMRVRVPQEDLQGIYWLVGDEDLFKSAIQAIKDFLPDNPEAFKVYMALKSA